MRLYVKEGSCKLAGIITSGQQDQGWTKARIQGRGDSGGGGFQTRMPPTPVCLEHVRVVVENHILR